MCIRDRIHTAVAYHSAVLVFIPAAGVRMDGLTRRSGYVKQFSNMVGRYRKTDPPVVLTVRGICWHCVLLPAVHDIAAVCQHGKARHLTTGSGSRSRRQTTRRFFYGDTATHSPGHSGGFTAGVFIPATGEFVIPDLLGGGNVLMIGRVLYSEFNANHDWPVASAVAIALVIVLVVPMMLYHRVQAAEASRQS